MKCFCKVFILLFSFACSANILAEDLKVKVPTIGVLIPLSGSFAALGEKVKLGIDLAVKEYASKIKIVYEDADFDAKKTLTAYQSLILKNKVSAILGPFGPGPTLAIAEPAKAINLPVVALSSCQPDFIKYKNIFCIYPGYQNQIETWKNFMKGNKINDANSLVLIDEEAVGRDLWESEIAKFLKTFSPKTKFKKHLVGDDTGIYQVLLLKEKHSDIISFLLPPNHLISAIRKIRELNIQPKYIFAFADQNLSLMKQNAQYLDGTYWFGGLLDLGEKFKEAFAKELPDKEVDIYAALGYDSMKKLIVALIQDSKIDLESLSSKLIKQDASYAPATSLVFQADRTVSMPLGVHKYVKESAESGRLELVSVVR